MGADDAGDGWSVPGMPVFTGLIARLRLSLNGAQMSHATVYRTGYSSRYNCVVPIARPIQPQAGCHVVGPLLDLVSVGGRNQVGWPFGRCRHDVQRRLDVAGTST